jgi:hypothetical protein
VTETCLLDTCEKSVYAKKTGYCRSHHLLWLDYGDPLVSDETRFWSFVIRRGVDDCWRWVGGDNGRYGVFMANGKLVYAHRFSYELHTGMMLGQLEIDHIGRCKHPWCVNPLHLRPANRTQQNQNRRYRNKHGLPRGVYKNGDRFGARFGHNGKNHYFGTFDTPELAGEVAQLGRNGVMTHNDADRMAIQ